MLTRKVAISNDGQHLIYLLYSNENRNRKTK